MLLNVYWVALEVVRELRPVIEQIGRHNRNLADQLDRSSVSVPLAIAEGSSARGKIRNAVYQRGICEMREARSCCDVALACGYVASISPVTSSKIDHVIGALVKIVR
ncbi:MAG: four helix bundle protein [Deltaproteobacteria bacterium]|nr:four helix bundle protein [Deltaproteobacteria bacterium]